MSEHTGIEKYPSVSHHYVVEAPGFVTRWTVAEGDRTGFVWRIEVQIDRDPMGKLQGVRIDPWVVRVLNDGTITTVRMNATQTFGYTDSKHRAQWLIARLDTASSLRAQLVQWVEMEEAS